MLDFLIVIVCLLINAVFSAFEMAFVTISKDEMDELAADGSKSSPRLTLFKRKPERTLSVIQIGITLVGSIAAAVGGTGAAETLEPYLVNRFAFSTTLAGAIAVTVVILPLTYFSVVFGELVPKSIALRYPKNVLNLGTSIIYFIDKILSPIVTFLEVSTDLILRLLKLRASGEVEEVSDLIDIGHLPGYHRKFVYNLIALKSKRIKSIMIPWNRVSYLNFSDTDSEAMEKIDKTSHSRFPVVDADVLVGVLHIKEWDEATGGVMVPWQSILGPVLQASENEKILEVFLKMQEGNHHQAIIVNDFGQFVGFVTIEDILEGIVGDIKDDLERNKISRILSQRGKIKI